MSGTHAQTTNCSEEVTVTVSNATKTDTVYNKAQTVEHNGAVHTPARRTVNKTGFVAWTLLCFEA